MLIQLIISILLFWLAIGIGTFVLQPKKFDYFEHFPFLLIFYLVSSALAIQIFSELLTGYLVTLNYVLILIPVSFVAIGIFIDYISDKHFPIPEWFLKKHDRSPLLRMNYKMILTKFTDVLFQDIIILIWVLLLYGSDWSVMDMTILFLIMFPLLHTPLFFNNKGWMPMYYIGFSFFAFVIPYILINIENGLFYLIAAHFFTYIVGRVGFGMYFKFKKQKNA